jgi:hypothetical protein
MSPNNKLSCGFQPRLKGPDANQNGRRGGRGRNCVAGG